jgi:hypothetical protein
VAWGIVADEFVIEIETQVGGERVRLDPHGVPGVISELLRAGAVLTPKITTDTACEQRLRAEVGID